MNRIIRKAEIKRGNQQSASLCKGCKRPYSSQNESISGAETFRKPLLSQFFSRKDMTGAEPNITFSVFYHIFPSMSSLPPKIFSFFSQNVVFSCFLTKKFPFIYEQCTKKSRVLPFTIPECPRCAPSNARKRRSFFQKLPIIYIGHAAAHT